MICRRVTAILIGMMFSAGTGTLFAQPLSETLAQASVFQLDLTKDAIICGAELAGEIGHTLYDHIVTDDDWDGTAYDKSEVNAFDRALMHSYSSSLDTAGDLMVATTIAVPFLTSAAFLYADERYSGIDLFTDTVMFAETMAISHTIAHITKGLVLRTRPYMYYDITETPEDDWNRSFYSGHTTMAFAAATFTSYTFCNYFPESGWKIPVVAGSYALAAATGVIRVQAGCHFATDVIVGALTGTAIGFLVPWCHKLSTETMQLSLLPTGASVCFKL